MTKDQSDYSNEQIERLKQLANAADRPLLNLQNKQSIDVKIHPDTSVSRGKFLPHPLLSGEYKAHPITIRAMKKSLFSTENDIIIDLQDIISCQSCHRELDLQFWDFCPFCETSFS